ncbi:MAG TPA: hypothetical protein V6C69_08330, partial [Trichormus sp.]
NGQNQQAINAVSFGRFVEKKRFNLVSVKSVSVNLSGFLWGLGGGCLKLIADATVFWFLPY